VSVVLCLRIWKKGYFSNFTIFIYRWLFLYHSFSNLPSHKSEHDPSCALSFSRPSLTKKLLKLILKTKGFNMQAYSHHSWVFWTVKHEFISSSSLTLCWPIHPSFSLGWFLFQFKLNWDMHVWVIDGVWLKLMFEARRGEKGREQ